MKKTIFYFLFVAAIVCSGQDARAQFEVTDPTVDGTLIEIQSDTLAPMLEGVQTTATSTADMARILQTPYVVTGKFASFDGTAAADASTQAGELMPALSGSTYSSTTAKAIGLEDDAGLTSDKTAGNLKGNTYQAVLSRQKTQAENLEAMGVDDFKANVARLDRAETMTTELSSAADIMQATVMGAAVGVENLKQAVFNGKEEAAILTALNAQAALRAEEDQRYIDDHEEYRKQLLLPVP